MWIDISVLVENGMHVWGGDPPATIEQIKFLDKGDVCNLTRLQISAHTGTHMDAPRHFLKDNPAGIDSMPLDAVIGPARLVEIKDPTAIGVAELEPLNLQPGERILFKTRNSSVAWNQPKFYEDFVYISHAAALYMGRRGIRTVVVDYLSVGGFWKDTVETHEALLGAGIWIVEGVNLSQVEPGDYDLVCLPVKIKGSDGAPARAVIRKR